MKKEVLVLSILSLILFQCVEEIEIRNEGNDGFLAENILVVEATVTNEMKRQVVYLSSGKNFFNDSISPVRNAQVHIVDGLGNTFSFTQSDPGIYVSEIPFQALPGNEYRLEIETEEKVYHSEDVVLPPSADLSSVFAKRFINDSGVDGIGIFINTSIPSEGPVFLRYTYEETYKIIAPLWAQFDMVVVNPNPPYAFDLVPRDIEKRVCYATQASTDIIQNEAIDLTGNTIENFMVRFLPRDNPFISHRYSILVKQMVQSEKAFTFYQTLNKFSSSDNVFTAVQPGFIEANIVNVQNPEEKVIGYFEVVNQIDQRIFLNYDDFFLEEPLPSYFINCDFQSAPPVILPDGRSPLAEAIESGEYVYVRDNDNRVGGAGPFFVARRVCGDCTAIGSTSVPEFWVED